MDITPQDTTQQSISDDQELAKALAGVLPDAPEPAMAANTGNQLPSLPGTSLDHHDDVHTDTPALSELPQPTAPEPAGPASVPISSELDSIKRTALKELRPLMDKVELPPEEKFDTYLMLIRSTDDAELINPAHTVALTIEDEKRRAEALLEIIKEIDYLSRENKA